MTDHLRAQALRIVRLFAVAFVAQLVTTGTANLGWKTLAALGIGAAEAVVRQIWPTAPATPPEPAPSPSAGG